MVLRISRRRKKQCERYKNETSILRISVMKDPNRFTVAALKELLAARGLSSAGTKVELISRMMDTDPSGAWMDDERNDGGDDGEDTQRTGASGSQPTTSLQRREIDLYKREKELAGRELAVVRLELEVMRKRSQTERAVENERP